MKYLRMIILLFLVSKLKAQDPQISQSYASPMFLSPSFAGTTEGSRLTLLYRNQWPSIKKAFVTYIASYDHNFYKKKSGLGLIIWRDIAGSGIFTSTDISLQYVYNIQINRYWDIRPSIQVDYMERKIDYNRLIFGDQLSSGSSASIYEDYSKKKVQYPDFAASVLTFSKYYWAGITILHLLNPNQSLLNYESIDPKRWVVFGGRKYGIKGRIGTYREESVSFTFLYKHQNRFDQLDIGMYYLKKFYTLGLWYRGIPLLKAYKRGYANHEAFVLMAGISYNDVKIAYSYDITASRLYADSGGAHEVSLVYEFLQSYQLRKKRRHKVIPCPKF